MLVPTDKGQGFTRPDGSRHLPSTALVMNLAKPLPDKPSLLKLDNVRSFFHEVGHGLHALLTETKYAATSRVTDRDFVEIPSILFEYFFWTARHIKDVSCHYSFLSPTYEDHFRATLEDKNAKVSKEMPDDLIEKLLHVKHKDSPLAILQQLHFSLYDMEVHSQSSYDELEQLNLCKRFNQLKNELMSLKGGEAIGEGWEWYHGESAFRTIVNNNNAAGYYCYLL